MSVPSERTPPPRRRVTHFGAHGRSGRPRVPTLRPTNSSRVAMKKGEDCDPGTHRPNRSDPDDGTRPAGVGMAAEEGLKGPIAGDWPLRAPGKGLFAGNWPSGWPRSGPPAPRSQAEG